MLPGLFRTLIGLVVAWFVFRLLDRMFGGRGRNSPRPDGTGGPSGGGASRKDASDKAKDDHLGEYVEFEEVAEEKGSESEGN